MDTNLDKAMLHFGYMELLKVNKTAISQLILLIWLQFGSIKFYRPNRTTTNLGR